MVPYELTPAAEADLREIARYTLRQWGVRQQRRYARQLEACFRGIADGSLRSRDFSAQYPQVRVTRCQHHYVFSLRPAGQKPRIFAVLHEHRTCSPELGSVFLGRGKRVASPFQAQLIWQPKIPLQFPLSISSSPWPKHLLLCLQSRDKHAPCPKLSIKRHRLAPIYLACMPRP